MGKSKRRIFIAGIGRRVTLGAYVKAVKNAKENPKVVFRYGLTCWWPCTGEEIVRQFSQGVSERINNAIPYIKRGIIQGVTL